MTDHTPPTPHAAAAPDNPTSTEANVYDMTVSPGRARLLNVLALIGLAVSAVAGFLTEPPTLWGLLPIVLYAALALLGMEINVATVVALLSGVLILQPTPVAFGKLMGDGMADSITMIGLIIMLGAGVGEVLLATGVATTIVHAVMRVMGDKNPIAVIYGLMLAPLILVAGLGTLAGALAISAPILLPIAARLGYTRSATAAMLFLGGCAGLALAPFAGSNVAIMDAAGAGYLDYLIHGAGPLAILSLALGPFVVKFIQKRTEGIPEEQYEASLREVDEVEAPKHARRATVVFVVVLLASVIYATIASAGTSFPLVALPAIGIAVGLAGRLSVPEIAKLIYRGAAKLVSIFVLFWLLAGLFIIIEKLAPFEIILKTYETSLSATSPFVFAIIVALIGWVGIPGATAAQVVLLHKVFGPLSEAIGVPMPTWIVVLLFASKTDTYGPFPNGNMIGAMGLAQSKNLRNMLITGWMVLIPATLMYLILAFFQTR
ncbi:Na+/H+ antiporter NhaC family protein [Nigerium massiliense]|uniref:Na+/H+ antiporter NhaC family protein n=1 Tax=Nigerium massiliense TaxID=1522317 RepID=UPI000AD225BD|nr:Na+/H+ antiporter NhaC family protein [Nigerium massiliense]